MGTSISGEFECVVYKIRVVKPEEISVLDNTQVAEITLVICTPITYLLIGL